MSTKENQIMRMTGNMNQIFVDLYFQEPCAEEIRPMVRTFCEKAINAVAVIQDCTVCDKIEEISEMLKYVAAHTWRHKPLNKEDMQAIQKIFDELDALYAEVMESSNSQSDGLSRKISCISEILCKNRLQVQFTQEKEANYRDGMIFQNYEHLWKIIHRVNSQWDELCNRGFALQVFYDFWEAWKYERAAGVEPTEDIKFANFMSLLDGKKKFVPIYEFRPVCFKVVDNDFDGEIVKTFKNRATYRLSQVGE